MIILQYQNNKIHYSILSEYTKNQDQSARILMQHIFQLPRLMLKRINIELTISIKVYIQYIFPQVIYLYQRDTIHNQTLYLLYNIHMNNDIFHKTNSKCHHNKSSSSCKHMINAQFLRSLLAYYSIHCTSYNLHRSVLCNFNMSNGKVNIFVQEFKNIIPNNHINQLFD